MAISYRFILENVKSYFNNDGDIFVAPNIPQSKLDNVMKYFNIDNQYEIMAIHDNTIFGAADVGAAFTGTEVVFRNYDFGPLAIEYESIQSVSTDSDNIIIKYRKGDYIYTSSIEMFISEVRARFANFLNALVKACKFDSAEWIRKGIEKVSNGGDRAESITEIRDLAESQVELGFMPNSEITTDTSGFEIYHEALDKQKDGEAVGMYKNKDSNSMMRPTAYPNILLCAKAMYIRYKPKRIIHIPYRYIHKVEIQGDKLILDCGDTFDISHVINPLDYDNFARFINTLKRNLDDFAFESGRSPFSRTGAYRRLF